MTVIETTTVSMSVSISVSVFVAVSVAVTEAEILAVFGNAILSATVVSVVVVTVTHDK